MKKCVLEIAEEGRRFQTHDGYVTSRFYDSKREETYFVRQGLPSSHLEFVRDIED